MNWKKSASRILRVPGFGQDISMSIASKNPIFLEWVQFARKCSTPVSLSTTNGLIQWMAGDQDQQQPHHNMTQSEIMLSSPWNLVSRAQKWPKIHWSFASACFLFVLTNSQGKGFPIIQGYQLDQIRQFATIDPATEERITTVAEAGRSILWKAHKLSDCKKIFSKFQSWRGSGSCSC